MVAQFLFLDGICYKLSFFIVGHCSNHLDLLPLSILCPQLFLNLPLVVSNYLVGHIQNLFTTSIILLQLHHLHIHIVFSKQQDIFNCGTTERINRLRIITNHAYVFMSSTQEFDDFILGRIGILILINHNVTELVLVFVQGIRMVFEYHVKL